MIWESDGQSDKRKKVFLPIISENEVGWRAGGEKVTPEEFEYYFLNATAQTSIDYELRSAREGSLYQIEYVCPQTRNPHSQKVSFTGYIFVKNEAISLEKLKELLEVIYVGGERKYGWGKLFNPEFQKAEEVEKEKVINLFDQIKVKVDFDEDNLFFILDQDTPVLAHVLMKDGVNEKLMGKVEVLEQRYTEDNNGKRHFGKRIFLYPSFMPGSLVKTKSIFTLKAEGFWEV
ncbi:hypothetical protein [Carboxydothermus pertinax]|uniref:Uncharacterized protein n=1 Tax=Carboxydothermus pertinax TaxID=870242 RepID=A0A1L8CWR8_9THEO|nr:hypothetical protein [Carboxydothermus pertinax]GAV23309.1 hypothetical protein cpu_18190 [Carboxydothermus pertinax]